MSSPADKLAAKEAKAAAVKAEKEAALSAKAAEKEAAMAATKAEREAKAAEKEAAMAAAKAEKEAAAAAKKAEKDAKAAEERARKEEERAEKAAAAAVERETKLAAAAEVRAAKDAERAAATHRQALLKSSQCQMRHPWSVYHPGRPLPPGTAVSEREAAFCVKCHKRWETPESLTKDGYYRCTPCGHRMCFDCLPLTKELQDCLKEQAETALQLKQALADSGKLKAEKHAAKEAEMTSDRLNCRGKHPLMYVAPFSPVQDGRSGWFQCKNFSHYDGKNGCHYEHDGYWHCSTCNDSICLGCLPLTKELKQALAKRDGGSSAQVAPLSPEDDFSAPEGASTSCPKGHALIRLPGGVEPRSATFACDRCAKSACSRWDGYWWCQVCAESHDSVPTVESHIVGKCCLPVPKVIFRCKLDHNLQLVKQGVAEKPDEEIKCMQCRKYEKARAAHWFCSACCHVLCGNCGPVLEEDIAAAGPKATDAAELKAKKLCPNAHALRRTTVKLGHGPGWNHWNCGLCKKPGTTFHHAVHACAECCFIICAQCLPSRTEQEKDLYICDYCWDETGRAVPATRSCDQCAAGQNDDHWVGRVADSPSSFCEKHLEEKHRRAPRSHQKWRVALGRKPYCLPDLFDALTDAFFNGNRSTKDRKDDKPLFEEDDDMIVAFARLWEKKTVPQGEYVCKQGEPITHLYLNLTAKANRTSEYWSDSNSFRFSLDTPEDCEWSRRADNHELIAQPFWAMDKHWCSAKVHVEDAALKHTRECYNEPLNVTFLCLPRATFNSLPEQLMTRVRQTMDELYAKVKAEHTKIIMLRDWSEFASQCHNSKDLVSLLSKAYLDSREAQSKQSKLHAMMVVGNPSIDWTITKHIISGLPIRRAGRVWMAVEFKNDGIVRMYQGHWVEEYDGTGYTAPDWHGSYLPIGHAMRIDPKTIKQ